MIDARQQLDMKKKHCDVHNSLPAITRYYNLYRQYIRPTVRAKKFVLMIYSYTCIKVYVAYALEGIENYSFT